MRELELRQLDPNDSESICSALRTWAPVLDDFYKSVIACGSPPDVASGVVISFWECMLAASFDRGEELD